MDELVLDDELLFPGLLAPSTAASFFSLLFFLFFETGSNDRASSCRLANWTFSVSDDASSSFASFCPSPSSRPCRPCCRWLVRLLLEGPEGCPCDLADLPVRLRREERLAKAAHPGPPTTRLHDTSCNVSNLAPLLLGCSRRCTNELGRSGLSLSPMSEGSRGRCRGVSGRHTAPTRPW